MTKELTIDASGKKLGRVASSVAKILMGKTSADFENHKVADVRVVIDHASKLDISEKKRTQEVRKRYSGYPGGQKVESLGAYMERKSPKDALAFAVRRMLPRNRLLTERMKRLIIND